MNMSSVLVGMFDTQAAATQARIRLLTSGFASSAVTITGGTSQIASTTGGVGSETPHEGGIAGWFKSLFGKRTQRVPAITTRTTRRSGAEATG